MAESEYFIKSRKFRNKLTGEIVTQIPMLEIRDYEEIEDEEDLE